MRLFESAADLYWRGIHFAAFVHIVGWVKRDDDRIHVGFVLPNTPQQFEITTKLANPTESVAGHRLSPTYDFSFRPTKPILPFPDCFQITLIHWLISYLPQMSIFIRFSG
jgi:hypothetical protein